jgi:RNA polymerase sigma-70 factor (ECF subfamily)
MLRGWQHAGELSPKHAGSWLHKAARNTAVPTCHRGRRAGPSEVPLDENTVPATGGGPGRMAGAVLTASALDSLSADHREVIVELLCRGRPAAGVAALLGVPEGTVGLAAITACAFCARWPGNRGSPAHAPGPGSAAASQPAAAAGPVMPRLVPVGACLGRLAPAATLTSRSAGAMQAVRDWSDQ